MNQQKTPLFFQLPESWNQVVSADSKSRIELLREFFGIHEEDGDRANILDDLLITTYRFSEEQRLAPLKTWVFLSIMCILHKESVGNEKENKRPLRMEESFELFKRLLVAHSIQRPPYSVRVFGLDEGKLLTRFAAHTYFLHYRLYQYVFTKKRLLDLSQKTVKINFAPDIPPLSLATIAANPTNTQSEIVGKPEVQ